MWWSDPRWSIGGGFEHFAKARGHILLYTQPVADDPCSVSLSSCGCIFVRLSPGTFDMSLIVKGCLGLVTTS